jgi:biotin carboxyl carrier protein
METDLPRPPIGDGRIKAPIPGQVTQVIVSIGDEVELGEPLLVLEAMKMENEIRAPRTGRVKALNVLAGQRVALNEVLAEID